MKNMIQPMRRPIISESVSFSIASILSFCAGLVVFVVGILKMTAFRLSETQLFFGVLLIFCVTMQMLLAGTLLEIYRWLKTNQKKL